MNSISECVKAGNSRAGLAEGRVDLVSAEVVSADLVSARPASVDLEVVVPEAVGHPVEALAGSVVGADEAVP